jgi:hypothetical protein
MVFGTSTTTTADLVRQTRSHVRGAVRSVTNVLAADFTVGQTQMVMQFPVTGVQVGQALEVGVRSYVVTAVNTATQTLGVLPLTTSLNHLTGARVVMRPQHSTLQIIDAMNAELSDLSAMDLYRVVPVAADSEGDIAVPAGALTVLDVWSDEPNLGVATRQLPESHFRITDTPTGIELRGRGGPDGTRLSFVTFGCSFGWLPLSDDTAVVTDETGLWGEALDILPLGAAVRLLLGTEAQRNVIHTQGETRRAEEVPPGAVSGALRNLAAIKQSRLVSESQRLRQRYTYTKRVGA